MVPEDRGSASERTSVWRAAVPDSPSVQDIDQTMAPSAGSLVPGSNELPCPTARPAFGGFDRGGFVFGRGVSPAAPDCWPP